MRYPVLLLAAAVIGFSTWGCRPTDQTEVESVSPNLSARLDSIDVAVADRDYYTAALIADRLVDHYKASFDAWEVRGRVYRDVGRNEEAIKSFRRATDLRPDDPGVWYELGSIAVTEQRYEDAASLFRTSASDESGPLPWHGLGRAYMEIGKYDSSRIALNKTIQVDSLYAGGHAASSELFEREGNIDSAIREMWTAQTLAEHSTMYRSELGRLLVIGERPGEAMVWLEPLLEKPPVRSQTLFALSRALRALGRSEEADHFVKQFEIVSEREATVFRFEERVRLNPSSIPDRLALADAHREVGDLEQALRHLLLVEKMIEPSDELRRNIGLLYEATGDTTEAAIWLSPAESSGDTL